MEIVQYYQTNNPCYKSGRKITPSGIVVHSTGANNPNLKRYVGPDDGILGKNQYNNHWNNANAMKALRKNGYKNIREADMLTSSLFIITYYLNRQVSKEKSEA